MVNQSSLMNRHSCAGLGWPDTVTVRRFGFDDAVHRREGSIHVEMGGGVRSDNVNVDVFTMTKGPREQRDSKGAFGMKKMSKTPVKKVKMGYNLGGDQLWQTQSVGISQRPRWADQGKVTEYAGCVSMQVEE
jgi:hypothetical protein